MTSHLEGHLKIVMVLSLQALTPVGSDVVGCVDYLLVAAIKCLVECLAGNIVGGATTMRLQLCYSCTSGNGRIARSCVAQSLQVLYFDMHGACLDHIYQGFIW
jgi:hypothetical protein